MGKATGWCKVATSTWGWPKDPQVYGRLEIEATPVIEAVDVLRERSGARVTTTHLIRSRVLWPSVSATTPRSTLASRSAVSAPASPWTCS
jgi:hypothetical protein